MLESVKAYKNTTVNWGKSQVEIMRLLEQYQAKDVRFTNISWETAEKGGLVMKKNTYAVMIEFFRLTVLQSGTSGKIPVRIIVPNVPEDEKFRNQAYRIIHWYLKTKFEAVATGLVDFEQEFLPHLMIKEKSGFVGTVWQMFKKPYENMLKSGETDLLKALPEKSEV